MAPPDIARNEFAEQDYADGGGELLVASSLFSTGGSGWVSDDRPPLTRG